MAVEPRHRGAEGEYGPRTQSFADERTVEPGEDHDVARRRHAVDLHRDERLTGDGGYDGRHTDGTVAVDRIEPRHLVCDDIGSMTDLATQTHPDHVPAFIGRVESEDTVRCVVDQPDSCNLEWIVRERSRHAPAKSAGTPAFGEVVEVLHGAVDRFCATD